MRRLCGICWEGPVRTFAWPGGLYICTWCWHGSRGDRDVLAALRHWVRGGLWMWKLPAPEMFL